MRGPRRLGLRGGAGGGTSGTALAAGGPTSGSDLHNVGPSSREPHRRTRGGAGGEGGRSSPCEGARSSTCVEAARRFREKSTPAGTAPTHRPAVSREIEPPAWAHRPCSVLEPSRRRAPGNAPMIARTSSTSASPNSPPLTLSNQSCVLAVPNEQREPLTGLHQGGQQQYHSHDSGRLQPIPYGQPGAHPERQQHQRVQRALGRHGQIQQSRAVRPTEWAGEDPARGQAELRSALRGESHRRPGGQCCRRGQGRDLSRSGGSCEPAVQRTPQ
ncbi:hypothetical protein SAMN04487820_10896 [Actinopolyspora mzabensis]|uniref:Uncharacterized protein n=1 Tax=Actinopolyspora mzabensis TaxID=995066 RepID=A0A1G9C3L3_ACTMZ|nr:hypothetical protein SAMN04487820_10896 [Actinopolyspora mzabensis]